MTIIKVTLKKKFDYFLLKISGANIAQVTLLYTCARASVCSLKTYCQISYFSINLYFCTACVWLMP